MRRKIHFTLLTCMLLALPCLAVAQGADSSSTTPATLDDHKLQDPILKKPHEWYSSALKPGWGVTAEYQNALSEFSDNNGELEPRNNFVITGYYDTWALSILSRHQFTGARLAFRDTKSRDLLSSWYVLGGSCRDIKIDSTNKLNGGMLIGVGARSTYGYDENVSFLAVYDFEVGAATVAGSANFYLYNQAMLGFRIPIKSIAVSIGAFVDASIGPSNVDTDSEYNEILQKDVYTYKPEIGILGSIGLSLTVGFNGNVLQ